MALLNIGASNQDDAFYRYKMPKLVTKVEGRGNGVKTNLVNMVDVAKALDRSPAYTTKYFGCELGAQSKYDAKTGTAIVNGSHDFSKLAGLLENFIKKYVQCYECGNPETEIVITKSQLITLKCAACGFVSDVNMRDKLTTFILKNPPEQKKKNEKKGMRKAEKERLKEGETADKEVKHVKKEAKKKSKSHEDVGHGNKKKGSSSDGDEHSSTSSQVDDSQDGSAEGDDDVHWQTDTSAKAAQQRIQEQLTAATSEMVILDTVTDEQEVATGCRSALAKPPPEDVTVSKQEGATGCRSALAKPPTEDMRAEFEDATDSKHVLFVKLVKEFKVCLEEGYSASDMASRVQAVRSQSPEQLVMNAFFEALFHGIRKGLAKDVGGKKSYLLKLGLNKHSQKLLLVAIEAFCSARPLELRKEVALVLKLLYDLDILDEDVILTWYEEDSHGCSELKEGGVKKFAKPFVEWLQNAESEEDD